MNVRAQLQALLNLAHEGGITVRHEPLGGDGGGMCRIRGTDVLFVDTSADPATQFEKTLEAVAGLPILDRLYLRPDLRELLENKRRAAEE